MPFIRPTGQISSKLKDNWKGGNGIRLMCRFQPRDGRATEVGRKTGDRGLSVMGRQGKAGGRRVPFIDHLVEY